MKKFYLKLLLIAFPFLMLNAQEEKLLVDENFQSWEALASSTTETSVLKKTNFSNEDLTYKLREILVDPQGTNTKFTNVTSTGYLMCAKSETPYIELSPLASITKVEFIHAATGGSRGYKLWKKVGNGDWVVVSDAVANPAGGAVVTVNINAENVALKFTNINSTQNAYLTDLKIWGVHSSSAPQVELLTSVNIEGAGTVTRSIISDTYDQGTVITLNATPNFGYRFVRWADSNGGEVSVKANYTFTLSQNVSLTAVFEKVQTYSLSLTVEGSKWGKILLSPEPVDGKYESGTIVTASVEPNAVTTFNYWEDGSSSSSRVIEMNSDKTITATFDEIPFIVGWDFKVQEPRGSRAGDYYSKTDNKGAINLYKPNAAQVNWLANTGSFNPSYPCARMWTAGADFDSERRYFEATFSTIGYKNIQLKSLVGANYQAYSVIKMQYSLDGIEFKNLAAIDITSVYNSGWANCDAVLPTEAEGQSKIYIRWSGDTTSPKLGNTGDNDGTALTNIYLYADEEILEDHDAPILLGSVPAEGSSNASVNGVITLTFNEKVKLGKGGVTLNGAELSPVFGSKTVTLKYSKLEYNTSYTLNVAAGALQDMSGNEFAGSTLNFTTMSRQQPIAKLFDIVVAQDGTGDFSSVQDAINSATANSSSPILIFVKNGKYTGHVDIPVTKPFIHLIGQSRDKVIVSDNRLSGDAEGQPNYHVSQGATIVVNSVNCYFENITFENSWGYEKQSGPQALAVYANNDKIIFNNCAMRSYQDTYLTSTKNITDRQYLKNCRIEGAVDYIYGGGDIFFDQCTLFNVRQSGGYIVAPSHKSGTAWGYVFSNCVLDGNAGVITYFGRPWQGSPKTVFINAKCIIDVYPSGWHYKMGAIPAVFADYGTMDKDGNPVDLTNRIEDYEYDVKDSNGNVTQTVKGKAQKTLTDTEAAQYTVENVLKGSDDWNPTAIVEPVTAPDVKIQGNNLVWNKVDYAINYIILRDDVVIDFTTNNLYEAPTAVGNFAKDAGNSFYTVVAVSEYGALSPVSNAVEDVFTSINEEHPAVSQLKVQQSNGILTVSNIPEKSSVRMFSLTGVLLYSAINVAGECVIPCDQNAILQVVAPTETKAFKILRK